MTIYLDFDGTVVEHEYPKIGRFNPGALETVKDLMKKGHLVILNTMRADFQNGSLQKALDYLNRHPTIELPFEIIALPKKIYPRPWNIVSEGVKFLEIHGIYIDDTAFSMPTVRCNHLINSTMVDWEVVRSELSLLSLI